MVPEYANLLNLLLDEYIPPLLFIIGKVEVSLQVKRLSDGLVSLSQDQLEWVSNNHDHLVAFELFMILGSFERVLALDHPNRFVGDSFSDQAT
jgi:hypothetical protein